MKLSVDDPDLYRKLVDYNNKIANEKTLV